MTTRTRPLSITRPDTVTGGALPSGSTRCPIPDAGARASAADPPGSVTTSSRPYGEALSTQLRSPRGPASTLTASAMISSSSAAISAYAASASRCTQAIEVPGRMSWNWCSSTDFHSRSSRS